MQLKSESRRLSLRVRFSSLTVIVCACFGGLLPAAVLAQSLAAAVLPSGRSVQIGDPATAFATIINTGTQVALGCSIAQVTTLPTDFAYQTTNPQTNELVGTPNTPVDIPGGQLQTFLFVLTPTGPFAPTDVELQFDCNNTEPAPIISGLNTLLLSASTTPVPDIIALAATPNGNGIVDLPGTNGAGAFAVATVNVGAADIITASADTGATALPVALSLCETDPLTALCLDPPGSAVTTNIAANATPTFSIFAAGAGDVAFDPAVNRIIVHFRDAGSVERGSTSVALRTVDAPVLSADNAADTTRRIVDGLFFTGSVKLTVFLLLDSAYSEDEPLLQCDLGGTVDVTLNEIDNNGVPSAGDTISAQFTDCTVSAAGNVDGSVLLNLESVTGNPLVDESFSLSANGLLDVTFTNPTELIGLEGLVQGDFRVTLDENAETSSVTLAGDSLTSVEPDNLASTVNNFSIARTDSFVTDEYSIVGSGSYTNDGQLRSEIVFFEGQVPYQGNIFEDDRPGSGSMDITARDSSSVTATATGNGDVRLDVDEDGDGVFEDTINTAWDAL